MKRVIKAATDGSSLKSKLAGYEDKIYTVIQEKLSVLSIQSENIVIGENRIDLQNLSIGELMMNVMAERDYSWTAYVKDVPDLVERFRDPDVVDYVVSALGPTFDIEYFIAFQERAIQLWSASELFEQIVGRATVNRLYEAVQDYFIERNIISAMMQYELTVKGNFADPEYYRWMTMKELFGRNPVFDETGDLEFDVDTAYSELESAISKIVPGFSISVDRSDSPRGQFTDVVNFNFANKTIPMTFKSVDLLKQYSSRGVKGLIMHILRRLSGNHRTA